MTRDAILEILRGHGKELEEKFTVRRIGILGSHVRDDSKPESDVDVLVELDQPTFAAWRGEEGSQCPGMRKPGLRKEKSMYRRMVTWVGSLGLVGWIIGFALAGPLFAVPITFTFTSTGSGTVNGVSFTDARYTVAVKGNTAAITNPAPNRYTLYATSVTMAITGFVTATVTDTVWIFDNQKTSGLGIGRNGPGDMLDVNHEAFAAYALATPLGPISGLTPSAI